MRASPTASGIVMSAMGTNGTTSTAPKRGCSPRCSFMLITSTARAHSAKAASPARSGGPAKVITERLWLSSDCTLSRRTPSVARTASTTAEMTSARRPSLMLGTHSTSFPPTRHPGSRRPRHSRVEPTPCPKPAQTRHLPHCETLLRQPEVGEHSGEERDEPQEDGQDRARDELQGQRKRGERNRHCCEADDGGVQQRPRMAGEPRAQNQQREQERHRGHAQAQCHQGQRGDVLEPKAAQYR